MTPNLKNSNSANITIVPNTADDEATVVTDNRSRETSRVTSEGGPPVIEIEEIRVTSEGGTYTPEEDEVIPRQKKNKVKEKWKRKLMNRLKTKRGIVQERRNWGMAKAMTKGEAWNAIVKHQGLRILPNTATTFNNRICNDQTG